MKMKRRGTHNIVHSFATCNDELRNKLQVYVRENFPVDIPRCNRKALKITTERKTILKALNFNRAMPRDENHYFPNTC